MMRRLALVGVALGLALPSARAEETARFDGHEIAVVSIARVKEFRDLKIKDPKKHDLVIVVLELRWKGEKRHVLIRDKDLELRDARAGTHECMLRFVQASAAPDESPARFEIPFQVKVDAPLASLRVGTSVLPLSEAAAPAQP